MDLRLLLLLIVGFLNCAFCNGKRRLKEGDPHVRPYPHNVTESCSGGKDCYQNKRVVLKVDYICCNNYKYSGGICVPDFTCESPCVNANCTNANTCTCLDDTLVHLNDTHCVPKCGLGEYNDMTTPPFACKSKCSESCIHGICTDFNTCTCEPGYKLKTESNFICEPHCESCLNGKCVAPNNCKCLSGFKDTDNNGECKPICDLCENGQCISPGNCKCLEGFEMINDKCKAVCTKNCSHGSCTGPNLCSCEAKYTLDAKDKFKCNPVCSDKCMNATCVAPDTCVCKRGFEPINNSSCRPKCEVCDNGDCIAPNKCRCLKGYDKNDKDECEPICSEPCSQNEFCFAPDTCKCQSGYVYDESLQLCVPTCTKRCVNSTCIAPEQCDCLSGYIKSNISSVCIPSCSSCDRGECIAPGLCRCYDDYKKINNSCVPLLSCKVCEGSCKNTICECANGTACYEAIEPAGVASTPTTMAGLKMTWMLFGGVGLLLFVIVIVTIHRLWRQRKNIDLQNDNAKVAGNAYRIDSSVVYTIPNTLMRDHVNHESDTEDEADDTAKERDTNISLLPRPASSDYIQKI